MSVRRNISRYLFPDGIGRQMMAGALLPLAFVIPVLLARLMWPDAGETDYWKVAAVFSGGVLFCVIMGFYKYFSFLLTPDQHYETDRT